MPNNNDDDQINRDLEPLKMTDEQKILKIKNLLDKYEHAIENYSIACVAPREKGVFKP